jgi:hypothetical protein
LANSVKISRKNESRKFGKERCRPNAIGLERGCVQSTSRSTLKGSVASRIFHPAGFAKLLRLVYDTAALRGSIKLHPVT